MSGVHRQRGTDRHRRGFDRRLDCLRPATSAWSAGSRRFPARGPEEIVQDKVVYNFQPRGFSGEEAPGASVFYRDGAGAIFHTYSCYARGLDILIGAYNYLDLVPKGRDEDDLAYTMAWVRHHDRYGV